MLVTTESAKIALIPRATIEIPFIPEGFVTARYQIKSRASDPADPRPQMTVTGKSPETVLAEPFERGARRAQLAQLGNQCLSVATLLEDDAVRCAVLPHPAYAWGLVHMVGRGTIWFTCGENLFAFVEQQGIWMFIIFKSSSGPLSVHSYRLTFPYNLSRGSLLLTR